MKILMASYSKMFLLNNLSNSLLAHRHTTCCSGVNDTTLTARWHVYAEHHLFIYFFKINYWVFKAPLNSYQLHFLPKGTSK